MKTKIIGFVCLCLGFCACNNVYEPGNPLPKKHSNGTVVILQFKKAEYKEHIMVFSPDTSVIPEDNVDVCLISAKNKETTPCLPTEVLDTYHMSPYIDLTDNYVLLNWSNFDMIYKMLHVEIYPISHPYFFAADTIMPDEAIIKNKWEDFDDIEKCWSLESFYVDHPLQGYFRITVDTLNFYNGGLMTPSLEPYNYVYESGIFKTATDRWNYILEKEGKDFGQQWILECNAAFAEYKEILIHMIEAGVLEDYAEYTYKR